ncbi:riboflavine-aldehyde-forming enzyme [Flammula alnicola]|nr:riboflavine-aldehyde-forming enzyme [Flammula alnicola]
MHFTKPFFATVALFGMANAFSGDATFFAPGLGACGHTNTGNDLIVALNPTQYSQGKNCGKNIEVHYKGKSVRAKVVDLCPGCNSRSIDLSPAAFSRLANQDLGRIHVTWNFV